MLIESFVFSIWRRVAIDMGRGRFPITLYKRDEFVLDMRRLTAIESEVVITLRLRQSTLNNVFAVEAKTRSSDCSTLVKTSTRMVFLMSRTSLTKACDDTTIERCVESSKIRTNLTTATCVMIGVWPIICPTMGETNTLILRPVWPLQQRCTYRRFDQTSDR